MTFQATGPDVGFRQMLAHDSHHLAQHIELAARFGPNVAPTHRFASV
jgi:hypothetical protein